MASLSKALDKQRLFYMVAIARKHYTVLAPTLVAFAGMGIRRCR
jgi:hypothetical protein